VGDEQRCLKLRQKIRKKKKAHYLALKHKGQILEEIFEGSPKSRIGVHKVPRLLNA
jgi:hypothetical protein